MRIVVNGWFHDQLTTGSGQYLNALAEWLPRVGAGHEFILVESANTCTHRQVRCQRTGESRDMQHRETSLWDVIPNTRYPIPNIQVCTPFDHLNRDLAKLWFEQVTFPRACRRLRADVAFVPYWGSPWWQPCPMVVTVHDLIPLLLPLYRGGPLQRAYTGLVSRSARRAHAVLTDSEASKRDIVTHLGIPAERIHAIHLAADPRFSPMTDPAELARVRTHYGLPGGPFLLYLGGFDARKNVRRMVEAYAKLVRKAGDRGSGIKLVFAGRLPDGDTAFTPDPRRIVTELGIEDSTHFTGWVDEADKPALYSMALGLVFVSEYEGFGLPVLEAMGCAHVSSDICTE
jgi:glycosyltransferase involved in cell wall biosynthesis